METTVQNSKPKCKKCNVEFAVRVKRGIIVRTFFNWLPLKRYLCLSCLKRSYVLVTHDEQLSTSTDRYSDFNRLKVAYKLSSSNTGQ